MNTFANITDSISRITGHALAWLVYVMMIVSCVVVALRYGFGINFIALQESITYLHASVFMLGSAYTLSQGEHVRVDIFYRGFSVRHKAIVDLAGTLIFLIPLCVYLVASSFDYVSRSWAIREASVESQGIAAVFLLKSLIPAMAVMLLIQACAELVKNIQRLKSDG